MAGVTVNNLYPPIVPSYMPAFIKTGSCKIYFSLSIYNNNEDINTSLVQVSVNLQTNNQTALNTTNSPVGIVLKTMTKDTESDRYYIEINPSDMGGGAFVQDQFYKVQIRFTGANVTAPINNIVTDSWLLLNKNNFSEWSTICIIKSIAAPQFSFTGLTAGETNVLYTQNIELVGSMTFGTTTTSNEYLKSYIVELYEIIDSTDTAKDKLLTKSNTIYVDANNNSNSINYLVKYHLQETVNYRLKIKYETNNLYAASVSYQLSYQSSDIEKMNVTLKVSPDQSNGRMKIDIEALEGYLIWGSITIRRTSSESNFLIWEDVHTVNLTDTKLHYIWYDMNIKSGIWYKYCVQKRNATGGRGVIVEDNDKVMVDFEDIFLTKNNIQLCVRYNPNISSFKHIIAESRTDTIGGKYPIIRRNGSMNYRQFPISGLITHYCDEDQIFTNKKEIYGDNLDLYLSYNEINNVSDQYDYIYEREFRQKVINFLTAGDAKLFRSPTEGNIIIKLTDVSFTPEAGLSRMLYSFSATVNEIADNTFDNYEKFGLITIDDVTKNIQVSAVNSKLGQIYEKTFSSTDNVVEMVEEKINDEDVVNTEINLEVTYLRWIRINFISTPYLILNKDGVLTPTTETTTEDGVIVSGYIVYINDKAYLVQPTSGITGVINNIDVNTYNASFILDEEHDEEIKSLTFDDGTQATVDYIAAIRERSVTSTISPELTRVTYRINAGQYWGTVKPGDTIIKNIYNKYFFESSSTSQRLCAIEKIKIEADYGAIFYIRKTFEDTFTTYMIDSTCYLEIQDDEALIEGLYFGGIHLWETNSLLPRYYEFKEFTTEYNNISDIENPLERGVYRIKNIDTETISLNSLSFDVEENEIINEVDNNYLNILYTNNATNDNDYQRYIYYNKHWYLFDKNNNIYCETDIIIDYQYELMNGSKGTVI